MRTENIVGLENYVSRNGFHYEDVMNVMSSAMRLLIRLNGKLRIRPFYFLFGLGIFLFSFVILQCVKTVYELWKA